VHVGEATFAAQLLDRSDDGLRLAGVTADLALGHTVQVEIGEHVTSGEVVHRTAAAIGIALRGRMTPAARARTAAG
ncbi:MAG TPA: hypothetical protein VK081_03900, partial [Planctomycetota bacterium]|nr:hypothetical protein [Planctomycetota bacterium]